MPEIGPIIEPPSQSIKPAIPKPAPKPPATTDAQLGEHQQLIGMAEAIEKVESSTTDDIERFSIEQTTALLGFNNPSEQVKAMLGALKPNLDHQKLSNTVIVAVGSLMRGKVHPLSDIDLVVAGDPRLSLDDAMVLDNFRIQNPDMYAQRVRVEHLRSLENAAISLSPGSLLSVICGQLRPYADEPMSVSHISPNIVREIDAEFIATRTTSEKLQEQLSPFQRRMLKFILPISTSMGEVDRLQKTIQLYDQSEATKNTLVDIVVSQQKQVREHWDNYQQQFVAIMKETDIFNQRTSQPGIPSNIDSELIWNNIAKNIDGICKSAVEGGRVSLPIEIEVAAATPEALIDSFKSVAQRKTENDQLEDQEAFALWVAGAALTGHEGLFLSGNRNQIIGILSQSLNGLSNSEKEMLRFNIVSQLVNLVNKRYINTQHRTAMQEIARFSVSIESDGLKALKDKFGENITDMKTGMLNSLPKLDEWIAYLQGR